MRDKLIKLIQTKEARIIIGFSILTLIIIALNQKP